ncbi:MAG TPA: glycosyltransferase, partial [Thermoanaerobaculia bacterium]|nr:glycosyltransferase [Thermoanaerobaculia bacterium]
MTLMARAVDIDPEERRLTSLLSPAAIDVRPFRASGRGPVSGLSMALDGFRAVRYAVKEARRVGATPIVLAFAPGPLAVGVALARRVGRFPLVTYFGADWDSKGRAGSKRTNSVARRACNRMMQDFIARSSESAICAGETLFQKIGRHLIDCHRTVPILGLPMQSVPDRRAPELPEGTRNPQDSSFRFLYVGALSPGKGVADLLEAIFRLREEGLPVRLEVVGTGPEGRRLAQRIHELSLGDVVQLRGYVSDPA